MARSKKKNPWWSSWPGALAMGLGSVVLLLPWWLAGTAFAMLPETDAAGVDSGVKTGPGAVPRMIATVFLLASVALPVLTVRWAKKIWLGYLLLGIILSGGFCVAGLALLGVL